MRSEGRFWQFRFASLHVLVKRFDLIDLMAARPHDKVPLLSTNIVSNHLMESKNHFGLQ